MKEFKKWNVGESIQALEYRIRAYIVGERQKAWKAALEWALEQDTWIGNDDDGEWGIDKYEIKEELNAKT